MGSLESCSRKVLNHTLMSGLEWVFAPRHWNHCSCHSPPFQREEVNASISDSLCVLSKRWRFQPDLWFSSRAILTLHPRIRWAMSEDIWLSPQGREVATINWWGDTGDVAKYPTMKTPSKPSKLRIIQTRLD